MVAVSRIRKRPEAAAFFMRGRPDVAAENRRCPQGRSLRSLRTLIRERAASLRAGRCAKPSWLWRRTHAVSQGASPRLHRSTAASTFCRLRYVDERIVAPATREVTPPLASVLVMLIDGRADPSLEMPHGDAKPLDAAEIETIRRWVEQGAKND